MVIVQILYHGIGKQEQLVQELQQVQEQAKHILYSANTTAGFSIVKYLIHGTAGQTIPHGLGAVPKMILVKNMMLKQIIGQFIM